MSDKEFFSFEEALSELRLKEEELKRLVSEGEIRAFREGETMRLRKADVENLRNELSGGEVVDLGGLDDELVFEDDADLDAGMATEEISEADTLLEDDVEDVGELEIEEERPARPARSSSGGSGGAQRVRRSAGAASRANTEVEEGEGTGMKALLILTSAVLFLGVPVMMAAAAATPSDIAKAIAGVFGADFGGGQ